MKSDKYLSLQKRLENAAVPFTHGACCNIHSGYSQPHLEPSPVRKKPWIFTTILRVEKMHVVIGSGDPLLITQAVSSGASCCQKLESISCLCPPLTNMPSLLPLSTLHLQSEVCWWNYNMNLFVDGRFLLSNLSIGYSCSETFLWTYLLTPEKTELVADLMTITKKKVNSIP